MGLVKLTPDQMQVSGWSGGTTTQICIFPQDSKYTDRQFLWRISSAAVELAESDFTPLPDYERLISTLRGTIVLSHDGNAPVCLQPYQVHRFSGGAKTHCVGTCTDFNLMLRRGRADGLMQAIELKNRSETLPVLPQAEALAAYCAEGCCQIRTGETVLTLSTGDAVIGNAALDLTVRAEHAELMLCQMWRLDSEHGPSVQI